jgi:hypothetical protein
MLTHPPQRGAVRSYQAEQLRGWFSVKFLALIIEYYQR